MIWAQSNRIASRRPSTLFKESVERELAEQGASSRARSQRLLTQASGFTRSGPRLWKNASMSAAAAITWSGLASTSTWRISLTLTELIATLNDYERREGPNPEIAEQRRLLQRRRRRSIEDKALPGPEPLPVPQETRLLGRQVGQYRLISVSPDPRPADWMEKVSDEQYQG